MAGSQFSPQNQGSTVIPVWFSGKTDVKCHSSRSCVYFILLQPRGQLSRVVHFLSSNIVLIVHLGFHMEHSVTSFFFFFLPVCWYLDDVWFFFFFWSLFLFWGKFIHKECWIALCCGIWNHGPIWVWKQQVKQFQQRRIGMKHDPCDDYNN